MFHQPKTQDPLQQQSKVFHAKRLIAAGYRYKIIERHLRVSMKSLRKWAEIHGIKLDSQTQTS